MDDFLPQLLLFPPHPPPVQKLTDVEYDKQIKALVKLLNQTGASKLLTPVQGGGDLLDILDPSINTLPYLHSLLAHIGTTYDGKQTGASLMKTFPPGGHLWQKMLVFMERFDPVQVRYLGHDWRRLIETVARAAELSSNRLIAIPPIRTAILRLDPSSSCFTSTHLLFVRFCLHAKAFQAALPILDHDIYHFPAHPDKKSHSSLPCAHHEISSTFITVGSGLSEKLNYHDHLSYFLYGAMLYLGLKLWERALLFLEIVIMSPTGNTASMIQVEAYKKWVLVGLLLKGKPLGMPRTTNSQTSKYLRAIAKPYDAFAEAFKEGNGEKLHAEYKVAQTIWQSDCNTGLVLQVLNAFRRFQILKLGNTYAALPISLVAQQTSPDPLDLTETEAYISSMIVSKQLNAILVPSAESTKPSMLRFAPTKQEGPLARSEVQNYGDLRLQIEKFTQLASHMKDTGRRLELSKEYLEWSRKNKKSKESGTGGGPQSGSSTQAGHDGYGVDEDMLADM